MLFCQCFAVNKHNIMRIKYIISVLLDLYRCACSLCPTETLADAIEYRCCREVGPTLHQLTFDGSIEKITCVTLHEEYKAVSLS